MTTLAEIFGASVSDRCAALGAQSVGAFDLRTVDPFDESSWDLDDPEKLKRAMRILKEETPDLLIGSPMCTPF